MKNEEIIRIGYVIQDYLISQKLQDVKPKSLMPMLIEKGFFNKDYRDGLPLRNLLRDLYDKKLLYLLPQVSFEKKEKNRYWFFNAIQL